MTLLIVIPAAGASRRMRGRDKLLELVDGEPLLRRQTRAALTTGYPVAVLLPPDAAERTLAVDGLGADLHTVADAAQGMSASLRLAGSLAQHHEGLAILLPDVPGISGDELQTVLSAYSSQASEGDSDVRVVRATDPDGAPGTPVVLPPRVFGMLRTLTGDDGGRSLLNGEDILKVPFPDARATTDLDTPEDWAAWREKF